MHGAKFGIGPGLPVRPKNYFSNGSLKLFPTTGMRTSIVFFQSGPVIASVSELLILQVHRFGLGCIKLSTSKGNKVHPKWYSDWSMCTVFFSAHRVYTAVQSCARKSTEFASGSKIVDENRGDMEGSSIVDEPGEG